MKSLNHLSEEQFAEWASGERHEAVAKHLRECAPCMAEVRGLSLTLEDFKTALHAQALQGQVACSGAKVRMRAEAAQPAPSRWKWMPVPALAALALVVLMSLPDRVKPPAPNTDAADDALLLAVSADVYRTSPTALRPAAELNKERNQLLTSSQTPSKNANTKEENR